MYLHFWACHHWQLVNLNVYAFMHLGNSFWWSKPLTYYLHYWGGNSHFWGSIVTLGWPPPFPIGEHIHCTEGFNLLNSPEKCMWRKKYIILNSPSSSSSLALSSSSSGLVASWSSGMCSEGIWLSRDKLTSTSYLSSLSSFPFLSSLSFFWSSSGSS